MRKRLLGILAVAMSAIMSVATIGAESPSGVRVVEHNLGDEYTITLETDHTAAYYDTANGQKLKQSLETVDKTGLKGAFDNLVVDSNVPEGLDIERLVLVQNSYDIVVRKNGEEVNYNKPAKLVVEFPMMVKGYEYYLLFGDEVDGVHLAKVEGEVGGSSTSSNGAVLADMAVPTVSGQEITINYNSLTGSYLALFYKTESSTGDVNPVVPVLAGIVVVSAAVIIFRRKRA